MVDGDWHLLLRADASRQIGAGHIMRCLAIAQAWQRFGGKATFVSHCDSKQLRDRLENAGCGFVGVKVPHPDADDLRTTLALLAELRRSSSTPDGHWVALDGYHFDAGYQAAVRAAGYKLLVIDDLAHLPFYHADLLLNQNVVANELHYSHSADTALLLGARYVLLRPEFLVWRNLQRHIQPVARNVLVTMGGSDPGDVTLKVIQALQLVKVNGLDVVVVVGPDNSSYDKLQQAIHGMEHSIRLQPNAASMPDLMAWADIAVSAGGGTCWELAFMSVPTLAIITAENQRRSVDKFGVIQAVVNLGWHEDLSVATIAEAITQLLVMPETRAEMAQRVRKLVDGAGVDRLTMRLRGDKVRLRCACLEDCELFWGWANDPAVRAASFSTNPILLAEHAGWFSQRLSDPHTIMFVGLDAQDSPIGQIRFDLLPDGNANVGVSVDRGKREHGYGSSLIDTAVLEVFRCSSIRTVNALIKPNNRGSIKAFEQAGFTSRGIATIGDCSALLYTRVAGGGQ